MIVENAAKLDKVEKQIFVDLQNSADVLNKLQRVKRVICKHLTSPTAKQKRNQV